MGSRKRVGVWILGGLIGAAGVLGGLTSTVNPPAKRSTPDLDEARAVLSRPAVISVLGDSTGNDGDEWVALWAQHLGERRRVTLHRWVNNEYGDEPARYGGAGAAFQIWNAGQPGAPAAWALDQLTVVQPVRPDLVIVSAGHNNTRSTIGPQLEELRTAVSAEWGPVPFVLVLQNPGRGPRKRPQQATLDAAATWAGRSGVPTIDATSAFTDPYRQMTDNTHPSPEGSQVWAEAVARALG